MFLPIGFMNEEFLPVEKIKISVLDLSLQRGYAVFDFLKLKNLSNPWSDWYLDRLTKSCSLGGIDLPCDSHQILINAKELLRKNGSSNGYVKIIVTGGTSTSGFIPNGRPSTIILGLPISPKNQELYSKGAALLTCNYQRDIPQIKSTNYMNSLRFMGNNEQYIDLLYYKNDIITETSRSNIFIVKDHEIFTPKSNILEGITRKRVLESAPYKILRSSVTLKQAFAADEIFITSTTKGVMPVTKIDEQTVGEGKVGPITRQISKVIEQF